MGTSSSSPTTVVEKQTATFGLKPLHRAVFWCSSAPSTINVNAVKRLVISKNADVNGKLDKKNKGRSPLHIAAMGPTEIDPETVDDPQRMPEIVSFLCEHGADPNMQDMDGRVPLFYAVRQFLKYEKEWGSIETLERQGEKSKVEQQNARLKVVKVLLKQGMESGQPLPKDMFTRNDDDISQYILETASKLAAHSSLEKLRREAISATVITDFPLALQRSPKDVMTDVLKIQSVFVDPEMIQDGLNMIDDAIRSTFYVYHMPTICNGQTSFDCYISYRAESDVDSAEKVFLGLQAKGLHPFLAKFNVKDGEKEQDCSLRGLRSSRFLLSLMSSKGLERCRDVTLDQSQGSLLRDLETALDVKKVASDEAYLIPVLIGEVGNPPVFDPSAFSDTVEGQPAPAVTNSVAVAAANAAADAPVAAGDATTNADVVPVPTLELDKVERSPKEIFTDLFAIPRHLLNPDDLLTGIDQVATLVRDATGQQKSSTDGINTFDCFLGYREPEDKEIAEKLYLGLQGKGLFPFLTKHKLRPSEERKEGCLRGLVGSRCFVSVLSRKGLEACQDRSRDHTQDEVLFEIEAALKLQRSTGNLRFVVPVLIGEMVYPTVDPTLFPDSIDGAKDDGDGTEPTMTRLFSLKSTSASFVEARRAFERSTTERAMTITSKVGPP